MARFAVLYTIHMSARDRRNVVEAWVEGVPEGAKTVEVIEALKGSKYVADFSERGVFMGNRRVLGEPHLPKEYTATDAVSIAWEELTAASKNMVQLNVRVPASERAAFMNAAAADGLPLAEWVRQTLRSKAGL